MTSELDESRAHALRAELAAELAPSTLLSSSSGFRGYTHICLPDTQIKRFWQNVEKTAGCWCWTGSSTNGYGRFRVKARSFAAHRVAWELLNGAIPNGMTIDHLCRNRGCVNPEHLEVVTIRENVLRGESITARLARMTHCRNGHEWTPENTYVWRETRRCRICQTVRLAKRCRRKDVALEKQTEISVGLSSAGPMCHRAGLTATLPVPALGLSRSLA